MHKTNISWADMASNPIRAINTDNGKMGWFCTKPSAGCLHCYAETLNIGRFGNGLTYSDYNRGKVKFVLVEKELESWSKRKKPTKIFVQDMSDIFHEDIPIDFILNIFGAMRSAPQHTFQVLTKRAERMYRIGNTLEIPPNVWLGVTVENQRAVDERMPLLLQTPATVHFLSCEPLLEKIDISRYLSMGQDEEYLYNFVSWVIVGGESGKNYRPMDLAWARSIRDQCMNARVPFWFKQESALYPGSNPILDDVMYHNFPCKEKQQRATMPGG